MTSTQGWIKMSERKPTNEDLPILLWNAGVPKAKYSATADSLRSQLGLTCFSHWMKAPEPPKKELTQRERDEEAHLRWALDHNFSIPDTRFGWVAALAYRDKQNAEDAKELFIAPGMTHANCDAIKALRRRCGLDQ